MVGSSKTLAKYLRLLAYVKPYRSRLIIGIVFGLALGPLNVAVLAVVKHVWAQFFEQGVNDCTWWQAVGVAVLLPLAMAGRGVCDFVSVYMMSWVGMRAVMDLRTRMFAHLQRLSLDYYTGTRTGELMSRVTNDTGAVQNGLSNVIEDIVKEPVTLLSVFGWLVYMDWKLSLAGLTILPVCLVPIIIFGRRTRRASQLMQINAADFMVVLQEALAGVRVIRAFGMEAKETEDFKKICQKCLNQQMRIIRARSSNTPLIELVAGVGGALVFIYAFYVGIEGGKGIEGSKLITFGLGLFMLYAPVKKLSRIHMQIQETLSAGERIFQLLDEQPSVVEAVTPKEMPRFSRAIEFDHVTFRYVGARDKLVLADVNLHIPAGSLTALVGSSGAGKTTLFNLVPRFYDPASGAVRIDGTDIREIGFVALRRQIGLVTQETFLFNDTVASNIAYGQDGASRDAIINAAKRAHAHDFIMQMPQQYDTPTGDLGVKLSGGQRQRIAIARALLKNPPILLLDEATNALDTESERAVQAALDDLMWGTSQRTLTMLVIAHRLSTVQHADRIVVLDQGRVAEQGTHAELIALGKTYKRLYDLQFAV